MKEHPLRCDACSADAANDGSLVLLLDPSARVKTVRSVRVLCLACVSSDGRADDDPDCMPSVVAFAALPDVFPYAERVIPEHDWERGTIERLARVLGALHARRRALRGGP